jgi:endonuclease/exonuclease/phosphatase family metal-dependent hydrolase
MNIKLLCLNVALFEENNSKLTSFLKEEKPDIVCLQEVSRKVEDSAKKEFLTKEAIDEGTGDLPYQFFAPVWVVKDFEKKDFHGAQNFHFDLGGFIEAGTYIKSKFKIIHGQNIFIQNHFSYVTDWSGWEDNQEKAIQVADLEISTDQKIRVINYHGIWSQGKQGNEKTERACEQIYTIASSVSYPKIICGDFNLFPDTPSMKILNEHFVSLIDTYNIQTTRPPTNELSKLKRNVVDYVFVSNDIKVALKFWKVMFQIICLWF